LASVKTAASFSKQKASLEDFLIALLKKKTWFYKMFDFIGVNPLDVETNLIELNKM
jgi:hypothetical protein